MRIEDDPCIDSSRRGVGRCDLAPGCSAALPGFHDLRSVECLAHKEDGCMAIRIISHLSIRLGDFGDRSVLGPIAARVNPDIVQAAPLGTNSAEHDEFVALGIKRSRLVKAGRGRMLRKKMSPCISVPAPCIVGCSCLSIAAKQQSALLGGVINKSEVHARGGLRPAKIRTGKQQNSGQTQNQPLAKILFACSIGHDRTLYNGMVVLCPPGRALVSFPNACPQICAGHFGPMQ